MSVRIVLADDHRILREGVRALLEREADLEVVGEASDGREVLSLAADLSPDVVVMDIAMPGLNGIEATEQLTRKKPGTKVLALSMHSDKRFVARMLSAGASGYLLKDCAFKELAQAVRAVASGQTYLSPEVAGAVVEDYVRRLSETGSATLAALTPREREVFQLLAEGKSTKQIALLLGVSVKTVETHRRRVMDKLHVDSMAELTKIAIREGLISLES